MKIENNTFDFHGKMISIFFYYQPCPLDWFTLFNVAMLFGILKCRTRINRVCNPEYMNSPIDQSQKSLI